MCVNRRFGGTSVYTRYTRRHIPEDGILIVTAVKTSNLTYCTPMGSLPIVSILRLAMEERPAGMSPFNKPL
jgi:hypothetical protein